MNKINIGVIGCGAISEMHYIPLLARSADFRITALVDKDVKRAGRLADSLTETATVTDDYRQVYGRIEAAVVALPNHLHAGVARDFLEKKIPVLVEKPMALTVADCDAMIDAAQRNDCVLAVGLSKRFFHAHQFVKQIIDRGLLGPLRSFDFRDGTVFKWPAATDFMFRKETGGGVLADTGPHTLDLLLWWLGDFQEVDYFDDARGGVEADCELRLTMASGVQGIVVLSRTRNLRKTYRITGERGTLEAGAQWANPTVTLSLPNIPHVAECKVVIPQVKQTEYFQVMEQQLRDFAMAVRDHRRPFVDGREGRRAIGLIEECYAKRQPLKQPWLEPEDAHAHL